jgi:hypothetical protein
LVGICSYLLVNFWYTRIAANQSSISALLTNRVGDCFLTIGMFAIFAAFGNLEEILMCILPIINCVNQKEITLSNKLELEKTSSLVDPYFITGFSDASKKRTSIVVFGTNLTSTVGIKFTLKQLAMVQLAPYQYNVIIGLLLSDGWLTFASKTNKNARLGFAQSGAHSEYFWFVFLSLSHYCSSYPDVRIRTSFGKKTIALQFFTRSMPCLTKLHSLFYPNGVKIIPHNIYELLTPVALAHLIAGDGSVSRHGLIICTNSYSLEDIVRFMNVLMILYRLECTIHKKKRQNNKIEFMIYIRQSSMPLLRTIVIPYMHSSMLYKLGSLL